MYTAKTPYNTVHVYVYMYLDSAKVQETESSWFLVELVSNEPHILQAQTRAESCYSLYHLATNHTAGSTRT